MKKTRIWEPMNTIREERICGTVEKFDNHSRWCYVEGDNGLGYLGNDYHKKCGELKEGLRVNFIVAPNSPLGPMALNMASA